jgi:hypothetical protein
MLRCHESTLCAISGLRRASQNFLVAIARPDLAKRLETANIGSLIKGFSLAGAT